MADKYVYRSDHPDVLAAWERWDDESLAFHNAIQDAKKEWGFPPDASCSYLTTRTMRVVGVKPFGDNARRPPEGWRLDTKHWLWVPFRSRKEGKAIAKLMDSLTCEKVTSYLPGMPAEHWQGLTFRHPGVRAMAGALWVTWSVDLDAVRNTLVKKDEAPYDHEIWQRVPLSEFYAKVEIYGEEGE